MINTAKSYANIEWTCCTPYTDEDYNRIYIKNLDHRGVAWMWDGTDTPDKFKSKVEAPMCSKPVESAGIDCSAFLSACWELPRTGTYALEYNSTIDGKPIYNLNLWNDLDNGDMLVNYEWESPTGPGHAMLVFSYDAWDAIVKVYDAAVATDQYKVGFRTYAYDYVSECTPRSMFDPAQSAKPRSPSKNLHGISIIDCKGGRLTYRVSFHSDIVLRVYDMHGKLVETLFKGRRNAGTYETEFAHAYGLYSITVNTSNPLGTRTHKIIITK